MGHFYQLNLEQGLSLDVFVPSNSKDIRLPVLYVMDGQHYLYNAIGFQQTLSAGIHTMTASPAFIVVGINTAKLVQNSKRQRAQLLNSNSAQLSKTLVEHIMPKVDKAFHTSGHNLYFGWQFAASFGLSLFNDYPQAFQGLLLASGPYYSESQIARTKDTLALNKGLGVKVYLSLGEKEKHALVGHEGLIEVFKAAGRATVDWNYHYHDNYSGHIDHFTTPFDALSKGLTWQFNDYHDLTFYSLQDVEAFGGVTAIVDYFKRRAKKYGVPETVGEVAHFTLFRYALEENNYQAFQEFERYLGEYKINNRFTSYAKFFAEHDNVERAIKVLKAGIKRHPQVHQLSGELAKLYLIERNTKQAVKHFQQALDKAKADEMAVAQYQQQLERLL